METIFAFVSAYAAKRSFKLAEKRRMKAYFRQHELEEAVKVAPPPSLDDIVGWTTEDGRRTKKTPFHTVLEQISSVDVLAIKPHLDELRSSMELADSLGVTAEPFTVALVGPPRQGKTQLSLNILKILRALGLVCIERSTQDAFCDDFIHYADKARAAKDASGRYLYHPLVTDEAERERKCKPEVLFVDEFQSRIEDPPDVPFLLNGVIPLDWMPPMANLNNKGRNFNFAFWLLSCNNEFVSHKFSVTAIRDRMHKRLIVLDGKAYEQQCLKKLDPSGSYLGGFKTCKGQFGVWDTYITQQTVGGTVAASQSNAVSAGLPPSQTVTSGKTISRATGKTVSNQKFREVKDTLSVNQPRCKHLRFVPFTELIIETLDAARAKLDMAINGAQAVQARVDAIREQMLDLTVDPSVYSTGLDSASSTGSEYSTLRESVPCEDFVPARQTLF
jgi:hypothetical protein